MISLLVLAVTLLAIPFIPYFPSPAQAATGDSVAFVANQLGNKLDRIWSYTDGQWLLYDPATPTINTLQRLEIGKGYWIGVSADSVLYFNVDPFYKNLYKGWNLIGWLGGATPIAAQEIAYTAGEDAASDNLGGQWVGQTFTTYESIEMESLSLRLMRRGTFAGTIPFYLATVAGGVPQFVVSRVVFDIATVTTTWPGAWYTVPLTGVLEAGQQYAVFFGTSGVAPDVNNFFTWIVDKSNPTYGEGSVVTSVDGGRTWVTRWDLDAMFRVKAKVA